MAISLTGLNFFKVEGANTDYAPDLKDINGNLYKQVIIEADADTIELGITIALPELSTLNYPLDTKLVVVLSKINTYGCAIQPGGNDKVNGDNGIAFSTYAEPGSSITITPVNGTSWSAVATEYVD